jgi:hypothetical protein
MVPEANFFEDVGRLQQISTTRFRTGVKTGVKSFVRESKKI